MIFHQEEKASREDKNVLHGVLPCLIVLKEVSSGIFCCFFKPCIFFLDFSLVVFRVLVLNYFFHIFSLCCLCPVSDRSKKLG